MLTEWARNFFRPLVEAVARFFQRLGLTPNQLTLIGLVLQALVAVVLATGRLQLGALLLILASIFDSFDGTLARLTGRVSRFGAFFDATVDRYAEALVLGGLLVHVVQQGTPIDILLVYAAIVGSLLVSYTRAKAESLGISCTVGILTRAERIALLVIGLFLSDWHPITALPATLTLTLAILALLSNVTAVQRVWEVRKATRAD
jgi:CDP-diacylglycerol--glycerol-3-phosphate 3-phosphatidyltransferase